MDDLGSKRGRTHNAENAREAILDAAEAAFAEHGFDGARVDAIAATAGYNKSLIFQYFKDKLGLYAQVIRRADDQTREMQNEALSALPADKTPDAGQVRIRLANFLGRYFDFLAGHPRILRIFMWEMAEGWQTFSKIVSQRDFDDVDQLAPVLGWLQKAGLLRSEINPIFQMTLATLVCHVNLAILPIQKVFLPGVDLSSPAALERIRAFAIDFILQGLLLAPSEAKSGQENNRPA
ncbi:MAG: TetR/AcrR family transcriptional regulator [Terriglobia bacterium]